MASFGFNRHLKTYDFGTVFAESRLNPSCFSIPNWALQKRRWGMKTTLIGEEICCRTDAKHAVSGRGMTEIPVRFWGGCGNGIPGGVRVGKPTSKPCRMR